MNAARACEAMRVLPGLEGTEDAVLPAGRRTRRQLLGAGSMALAGVLGAACTPGGGRTDGVPAATRPAGTIEFWQGWTTRTAELRVYLDQFEQQNPGVKVQDVDMGGAAGGGVIGGRPKAVASVLAGTVPDCLMVFKDMYALVVPAKVMVDLNKYVSRDKIDLKQFSEVDIKDRTFNGQLVVLPSGSGMAGPGIFLYWNKELFQQAGLNPEQGPKTWAELDQYVTRLTRPGQVLGLNNPTGRLFLWLYQNNGRFYSDTEGKKVGFDSAETRDALRYVIQLVQRQGGEDGLNAIGTSTAAFYQGKVAMTFGQDNFPSTMNQDPLGRQLSWGIAPMPVNQNNARARFQIPSRGSHGYGVTTGAKNPEGAWALTKFLTMSDAQCSFMTKDQGRVSPLKRCNTMPEMQRRPEFVVFNKSMDSMISLPFSPGDDNAVAALEKHGTNAALGKTSIDAAITAAVQEAQVALDEGWKTWRG